MNAATVRHAGRGYTLLELMVALSIIAVLTSASVSNFSATLPRYKLREAVSAVLATLKNARLRAVKESCVVVVNFDPDGDGRLDGDYVAFVDGGGESPGDGIWTPASGEALIAHGRLPGGVQFTRTSFPGKRLCFNGQGHLMGINRSIYLENSDGETRKITVYASGNSRVF